MGAIAAIGARPAVAGFALAGVTILPAAVEEEAVRAWRELPADVELVILTGAAAAAIAAVEEIGTRLTAVLP